MIWEKNQPSTGESDGVSWNAKIEKEKYLDQKASRERNERANEREKRLYDKEWMLTSVYFFAMESFGVITKRVARDILEHELKRPDLFDRFQTALAAEGEKLLKQSAKDNEAQKVAKK
jgi:hypothetical protein